MPQQYSVAEVCQIIDKKIKASPELQEVWVRGEITNYQRHASSGHIYITLSDVSQKTTNQRSTLRCTYFKFAQT
ncbi:MAG TPA: exodeoxyribonuclease VII large subunit, partial [Turneriella sp.]|nr:exodeoxyribonuclease VII large subunit [Turneriella sp.]